MAEAPLEPDLGSDLESLAIPPMDTLYLSSDLGFPFDDNDDLQLTFDDIDQFYFPSDSEHFLIPDSSVTPESDVERYLNTSSAELDSVNGPDYSGNSHSPVSSLGSGNCASAVSEATNVASPDSSGNIIDQKINVEEMGKRRLSKRKKGDEETDSSKCRRSSLPTVKISNSNSNNNSNALSEEEEKRRARLMRNRESAQLSRQRKKHYVEELEDKVRAMHSTIADLNNKIAYFMAENATLRQQLSTGGGSGGGAGMCSPQPFPMPMYPPMAYPWVPCAPPYVMKPPGSQVPLVPIPRLKSQQQSKPASKAKKNESKTKKVASVSLLGMLFFILLFGGLVPVVNVRYDNTPVGSGFVGDGFYEVHRGRVLRVDSHLNGSSDRRDLAFSYEKFDVSNRVHSRGSETGVEQKDIGAPNVPGFMGNGSEPLTASLYVPRNDKLVKIDGNLIIHSVLASEKAVASHKASQIKNKETGLVIPKNFSPALAIPDARKNRGKHSCEYRNPAKRQMALSSGSADALKDHFKSTVADGKMQQWFREGVAGPMLSSGMCTEVFQFDVSAPGAIVPASPVTNVSDERRQNSTQLNKQRNRRILHGHPIPLSGHDLNITQQRVGRNSRRENFQGNKTASSMVVSVLIDPREAGDGDIDDMIVPKSLSRIFVVVLLDRVKYVTYSCVLPRSGPHLVTA
ncbi:bZIP transcription factor 17-like [Durio zibethinus]|uniref:BZIP transcription factor 17-like n=1 Tax=Durio zibethinus TaxID=66656 RepID=A0A6P5Z267_DURZI|nr:bZIP transcription factor 17-like [Durio zibethinus]